MSLTFVAKPIYTADNASAVPAVFQPFKLPLTCPNVAFQGAGLAVVFYNAIFTSLSLELWADRGGAPVQKIATSSTAWTSAQITAAYPQPYSFLYLGFQFTPQYLRKGTFYHLALRATGYTGNATNHIAWKRAYPDPAYTSGIGFPITATKAAVMPLEANIFAAGA